MFSRSLILTLFSLLMAIGNAGAAEFDKVELKVNELSIELEYAHTFEQRAQGLMHRKSLCKQCGMLFNFKQQKRASMWMENTLIPLDVAFIRSDGLIIDIKPMQPLNLKSVHSSAKVQFAWEMNQGWFAQQGIKVGDKVKFESQ